jgi:hypothetical protein
MLPGVPRRAGAQVCPTGHLAGSRRRAQSSVAPTLPFPITSHSCSSTLFAGATSERNFWDEIRQKIFKNYALKSMDAVRAKLKQAAYIERNPKLVLSITSFPYIVNSL